jgi:exodeoxyribonuclease VII large subunit
MAVPELSELIRRISKALSSMSSSLRGKCETQAQKADALFERLGSALWRRETDWRRRVDSARAGLSMAAVRMRTDRERAAHAAERLSSALATALDKRFAAAAAAVSELSAKLSLLSPYAVLERGYSITTSASGEIIRDASQVRPGETVATRLARGSFESTVASSVA